jgi:hypothetical protein
MAADLVLRKESDDIEPEDESGLSDRQIDALEWLDEHGHVPAHFDNKLDKYVYSSDPQVRAYQMIFQGRFGGERSGAGRPRAAQSLAEYVRNKLQPKMRKALERGLDEKAGAKTNLDAIRLAMDIENREAKLQLDEDQQDLDQQGKEELIGTLFTLFGEASTGAVIEAAFQDLGAEEDKASASRGVIEGGTRSNRTQSAEESADSTRSPEAGDNVRSNRSNGRGAAKGDRQASSNPYTQAAKRRAAQRR